ncbi:MAG: hypothetical protein AB7G06_01995 [Bdellovibrionales bacterium]
MFARFLIAALLVTAPAFASEGEKASVPQFDPTTYAGQLFWLVITFTLLYVLMAKLALPRIGFVIEQRAQRLNQDIEQAQTARDKAVSLQKSFETGLSTARLHARETVGQAVAAAQAAQSAALAAQNQQLVARVQEAENKIGAAKNIAIASIKPAAETIAAVLVTKLAGAR